MPKSRRIPPPSEEDVPFFFDLYCVGGKSGYTSGITNVPIEMRECRASPGSMFPSSACVGNWYSWSWYYCVACMSAPLGMPTTIGGDPVLYGLCVALGCKRN